MTYGLRVVPITRDDANRYVEALHRHTGRLPGVRFCCAAIDPAGHVLGVAMAGDPKARLLRDGRTLEVGRVCAQGTPNVCSKLYGACVRTARALGYWRCITYTLESEDGASLRAAGWTKVPTRDRVRSWLEDRGEGRTAGQDEPVDRWEILLADRPPALVWPAAVMDAPPALFDVTPERTTA